MGLLYRGPVVRLVSLCRFSYLADVIVQVCFTSEIVSYCCTPSAVGKQIRCVEIVTPGSDRDRRYS
jgi:hypothetical protein